MLHDNNKSSVPYDILLNILISLPSKSLLRFQSVSTSWNAIIRDKQFLKAHLNKAKASGRAIFLLQRTTYDSGLIPGDQFEFIDVVLLEEFNAYDYPIIIQKQESPLENAHVLCSHDCLVLLHNKRIAYNKFVLWNPLARQHKTLVCPYQDNSSSKLLPHACGLCYDSSADDYKVVFIYISFYVVYSTNTDLWTLKKINLRILEESLPNINQPQRAYSGNSDYCCEGISTEEGCVYWSLIIKANDRFLTKIVQSVCKDSTIIYFDVKSEELKELPRPGFVVDDNEVFSLSTLKGCLSLTTIGIKPDIWIMEQDGIWKWFTKLTIEEYGKLLFCKGNGEVIFLRPNHHLSVHNIKQKRHAMTFYVSGDCHEYVQRPIEPTCLDTLYLFLQ